MSGADLAYSASCLRACYAQSGTDRAYAATQTGKVEQWFSVYPQGSPQYCYAMSATRPQYCSVMPGIAVGWAVVQDKVVLYSYLTPEDKPQGPFAEDMLLPGSKGGGSSVFSTCPGMVLSVCNAMSGPSTTYVPMHVLRDVRYSADVQYNALWSGGVREERGGVQCADGCRVGAYERRF
eukprot:663865-Rhodomonas_salina.1